MSNAFSPIELIRANNPDYKEVEQSNNNNALTPQQIIQHQKDNCPEVAPAIIQAINHFIIAGFNNHSFSVKMKKIREYLAENNIQNELEHKKISDLYKIADWDIQFNFPDMDENFESYVSFNKQKKSQEKSPQLMENFNQLAVKPVCYEAAKEHYINAFPEAVLTATNNLLKKNFVSPDKSIQFNRQTLLKEIYDVIGLKKENESDVYSIQELKMDVKFLNIEDVYNLRGWIVDYDRPAYNESYDGFWVFKIRPQY